MSAVIKRALAECERQMAREAGEVIAGAPAMCNLACLWLAGSERECFGVIGFDTRHRMIDREILFYGTVDRCHVHTREVLRYLLKLNAAAFAIAHNHPSGIAEPSQADIALTHQLRDVGAKVDLRLLDHVIVAGSESISLATRGLL